MSRLESHEDQMRGVVTFELESGERLCVDEQTVRGLGLQRIVRKYVGEKAANERLPVWQCGRRIGTLPAWFDPLYAKSSSFLYEPRAGDFKRVAEGWVADKMLGPGDLEAIPEFVWDDANLQAGRAKRAEDDRDVLVEALTGRPREG